MRGEGEGSGSGSELRLETVPGLRPKPSLTPAEEPEQVITFPERHVSSVTGAKEPSHDASTAPWGAGMQQGSANTMPINSRVINQPPHPPFLERGPETWRNAGGIQGTRLSGSRSLVGTHTSYPAGPVIHTACPENT